MFTLKTGAFTQFVCVCVCVLEKYAYTLWMTVTVPCHLVSILRYGGLPRKLPSWDPALRLNTMSTSNKLCARPPQCAPAREPLQIDL